MCKGQDNYITKELRKKLENLFPSMSNELVIFVYSKIQEDKEWHLEIEEDLQVVSLNGRILAEYEGNEEIWDSRSGEWGKYKRIRWEVRMSTKLESVIQKFENTQFEVELAPMKYFFEMVLKKLSMGLIDCSMFDMIKNGNEIALSHLFKELPKMSSLLSDCVDEIMKNNGLPNPAIITQLSAQTYEKRPIHGSLLFVSEKKWKKLQIPEGSFLNLEEVKPEQRKLEMANMRCFRKIIEMNSEGVSAVVIRKNASIISEGGWYIIGLLLNKAIQNEDVFWVDFKGTLTWSLRKNNKIWFNYKEGSYKQKVEEYLELDYQEKIRNNVPNNADQIIDIVKLLQKEKHGTSIVFIENTDNLKFELEWFHKKNRCVKLVEDGVDLKTCLEKMKGITAIDGALLADYSGKCYAIGVIFDGDTIVEGMVSRGARFNSISNYVQVIKVRYKTDGILGVIVSEDESVDVRVPKAEIDGTEAREDGLRTIFARN